MKEGTTRPLFLFHPIGGGIFCYNELVGALDGDFKVYGVGGYTNSLRDALTISDIAATYCEHIRRLQPQGSFIFIGYSLGAIIATEVAQEMKRLGRSIEILAFIDAMPFARRVLARENIWANFARLLLREWPPNAGEADVLCDDDEPRFRELLSRLNNTQHGFYTMDDLKTLYEIYRCHLFALSDYTQSVYGGKVVQYEASEGKPRHDLPGSGNVVNGFDEFWSANEVIKINANHYSIMTGTSIRLIARDLSARLNRLEARSVSESCGTCGKELPCGHAAGNGRDSQSKPTASMRLRRRRRLDYGS